MLWSTGKGTHSNQYIGQVKVRSRQGLEQYMFKESSKPSRRAKIKRWADCHNKLKTFSLQKLVVLQVYDM